MQSELMEHGPIQVGFWIFSDWWQYKKSGVYHRSKSATLDGGHAVRLICWGSEDGDDYWLIANCQQQTGVIMVTSRFIVETMNVTLKNKLLVINSILGQLVCFFCLFLLLLIWYQIMLATKTLSTSGSFILSAFFLLMLLVAMINKWSSSINFHPLTADLLGEFFVLVFVIGWLTDCVDLFVIMKPVNYWTMNKKMNIISFSISGH